MKKSLSKYYLIAFIPFIFVVSITLAYRGHQVQKRIDARAEKIYQAKEKDEIKQELTKIMKSYNDWKKSYDIDMANKDAKMLEISRKQMNYDARLYARTIQGHDDLWQSGEFPKSLRIID